MPRRESPLDEGDGALVRFARDLRKVREKAGNPTYRELSAQAHYSVASLSEAASARKLPSLAVTLAYVTACDGDAHEWEARWHSTAAELAATFGEPLDQTKDEPAPYAGLTAFQMDDSDRFFGRERLVDELTAQVRASRFVGVFGPSGCGKSSVLRAGLCAQLASQRHRVLVLTPGSYPMVECAMQLARLTGDSVVRLRSELAADPGYLHLRIQQAMAERPGERDVVLVVDQFEEVFTICADRAEREWLINALVTAATAKGSRARVVLGVRADFYGHCGQHPRLVEALRGAQVMVGPMTSDELRMAITEPAARSGCRVETALVTRLVSEATGQPGVLPLVSHALLETWKRRRGATITLAGYDASGGIRHALARSAEEVHATLTAGQREIARQIFLRLTALGEGTEDTKRRVGRHELGDDPDTELVLDRLAGGRLVTLDRDGVELAHEAMIRHWPRLRDWIAEDREGLRVHRQLTDAAHTWEELERDPGALYRGSRLSLARDWSGTRDAVLSAQERRFLHASLLAEAGEHATARRRASRLRRLVALLAVLLVLATAATLYAVHAQQTATAQRNAAFAQKAIREADGLIDTNITLAVQLVRAAYHLDPSPEARGSVLSVYAASRGQVHGHRDRVSSVAFSPNAHMLATASVDRTARVWGFMDSLWGQPKVLTLGDHIAPVSAAIFSPSGDVLATSSLDSMVRLWSIAGSGEPRQLAVLAGHADGVVAVAFSPDGHLLVTSGMDNQIRLWDVTDPEHPVLRSALHWLASPAFAVAFSPRSDTLAVGSYHDVHLYDVAEPSAPRMVGTAAEERGVVRSISFTPDGRTMATAGNDDSARLWDVSNRERPTIAATLTGHTTLVAAATFSPDGQVLATASQGGTLRLWDVTAPGRPAAIATLTGRFASVSSLAFAQDGHTLAVANDNRVMLVETDINQVALLFCGGTYPPMTPAEWAQHFPGLDFQDSCA